MGGSFGDECNGIYDCRDRSDEEGCKEISTNLISFPTFSCG